MEIQLKAKICQYELRLEKKKIYARKLKKFTGQNNTF